MLQKRRTLLYCRVQSMAMNIFLIEDDSIYAEFISKALGQNPAYKINHYSSAESALKALNGSLPDALIIDYNLPGISGIDFFETIKSKLKDHHKIIMLSAIEDGNMVLSFIQKGVRDYVIKDENVIESLVAVLEGKDDDYLFN
jgi:DNA-binding NarL/FixJ family response regulator